MATERDKMKLENRSFNQILRKFNISSYISFKRFHPKIKIVFIFLSS